MAAPTAQPNAYLRTKVLTAGPAELRMMLFDGAVRFARKGRQGLADRDYEAAYEGLSRCQAILMELINSLDHKTAPDLCERLAGMYVFLYRRLIDAGRERSPEIAGEVITLLEYERETWALLLGRLAGEQPAGREPDAAEGPRGGSVSIEG